MMSMHTHGYLIIMKATVSLFQILQSIEAPFPKL